MLLNDFYTIQQISTIDTTTWCVLIALNPEHPLYQGHFPGQPIVPGACMLQLIKECTQHIGKHPLQYAEINSCKFLSPINPLETTALELTIGIKETESERLQLVAEGKTANGCFIKLKAKLCLIKEVTKE